MKHVAHTIQESDQGKDKRLRCNLLRWTLSCFILHQISQCFCCGVNGTQPSRFTCNARAGRATGCSLQTGCAGLFHVGRVKRGIPVTSVQVLSDRNAASCA